MLFRPLRWALSSLGTMLALYTFFFVPLGERTLCDHVKRIARTREAQDLGRDVSLASLRVADRARSELTGNLAALVPDGGARYRPDIDDGRPRPSATPPRPR